LEECPAHSLHDRVIMPRKLTAVILRILEAWHRRPRARAQATSVTRSYLNRSVQLRPGAVKRTPVTRRQNRLV